MNRVRKERQWAIPFFFQYREMDVKFQALPEIVKFHEDKSVNSSFPGV